MLNKTNYILIGLGTLTVMLGFWMLAGSGNHTPNFWDADIMSFMRMNVAPATLIIGYTITGYGIFAKPFQKINLREQ